MVVETPPPSSMIKVSHPGKEGDDWCWREALLSRGRRGSSLDCELSKECGLSHHGPVGLKGWGVSRGQGVAFTLEPDPGSTPRA